jgi:hypothetical protein
MRASGRVCPGGNAMGNVAGSEPTLANIGSADKSTQLVGTFRELSSVHEVI